MDRCEFLKLSMEERRQILADQAEGMVDYYSRINELAHELREAWLKEGE